MRKLLIRASDRKASATGGTSHDGAGLMQHSPTNSDKNMTSRPYLYLIPLLAFIVMTTSGCELIGDIFKAGVWVGVIIVLAIVGIAVFIVGRAKK
jgi:hypothetical protein